MPSSRKRPPTSRTIEDRAAIVRDLRDFSRHWSSQIEKWKRNGTEKSTERKYAHQFWLDLLACFGYKGTRLDLFEYDARRASRQQSGRVDIFVPGILIGEIKSLHVNLKHADEQVWDYLRGGSISQEDYPVGAISTNFKSFHIWKTDGASYPVGIRLNDLPEHFDDLAFLLGNHAPRVQKNGGETAKTSLVTTTNGRTGGETSSSQKSNQGAHSATEKNDGCTGSGCAFIIVLVIIIFVGFRIFGEDDQDFAPESGVSETVSTSMPTNAEATHLSTSSSTEVAGENVSPQETFISIEETKSTDHYDATLHSLYTFESSALEESALCAIVSITGTTEWSPNFSTSVAIVHFKLENNNDPNTNYTIGKPPEQNSGGLPEPIPYVSLQPGESTTGRVCFQESFPQTSFGEGPYILSYGYQEATWNFRL